MTLLELTAVSKTYALETGLLARIIGRRRSLQAVREISLTLGRGRSLGIVGESGSGKSTLARLILGMEAPTHGTVRFNGQDLAALHGSARRQTRRRIQMVFQDPGGSLNPRKTVRRVLEESLRLAGADEHRAEPLLERVGLNASQLRLYPHELSGGQRQRVAIARALAVSPELVVADEPVSALDVSLQAQIVRLLLTLREELGLTLVFISHDLALVHHLCDEVVVMQTGQIVERGPPTALLHHPQHPYTKMLLDAVPGRGFTKQRILIPHAAAEPPVQSPTSPAAPQP